MIFIMAAVRHVGFSKLDILITNLRVRAIMPPNSKFRHNRTPWSRVITKKIIFSMVSVRHLAFGNFCFFVMFPSHEIKFVSAY